MTDLRTEPKSGPIPHYWYGLPHGYLPLDLDPPVEQLTALVNHVLGLPEDVRGPAERVLRFYAGVVTALNSHNVQGCAIGLHPDDEGGFSSSVLTFSTVAAPGVNPSLVLAHMAVAADEAPDKEVQPLELPCGTGFLAVETRSAVAPGSAPEADGSLEEDPVWQGTIAVTGPGTSDIVVVQLVTPALELADVYRDVLLGVGHSVSFIDPSSAEEADGDGEAGPGAAADTAKNPFG
ncbi:hypothetical protein [Streptomyces sp. NRRL S-1448]|uniref:hypothetical protein n=1 Tax=Streptomyces sp. NRRL S-1448 TaxID=1463883 RepID=UPI000A72B3BD|nr:hypothetical protein [Streptomyces sp. NRRL S-1448]